MSPLGDRVCRQGAVAGLGHTEGPQIRLTAHDDLVRALLPGSRTASAQADGTEKKSLESRVAVARRLCSPAIAQRWKPLFPESSPTCARQPAAPMVTRLWRGSWRHRLPDPHEPAAQAGRPWRAWLAVGRAMAEAEHSGDPAILASSVRAHVLTREKHTAQAVTLVRHSAGELAGSYDQRSPRYRAAIGLLLLRGMTAASTADDCEATSEFLDRDRGHRSLRRIRPPRGLGQLQPHRLRPPRGERSVAFGTPALP